MSLDIYLEYEVEPGQWKEVYSCNITHNLNTMAEAAGFYQELWRGDECGVETAGELAPHLNAGINKFKANPDKYRNYDSPNGWGTFDNFLPWLVDLYLACREYPSAHVTQCR